MDEQRLRMLDDLLKRFAGAIKALHWYSAEHPLVSRALDQLSETLDRLLAERAEVVMGLVEGQLIVDAQPVLGGPGTADTLERLTAAGIDRLAILRDVTPAELRTFIMRLPVAGAARLPAADQPLVEGTAHIRVSRLRMQSRGEGVPAGVQAAREAYQGAVAVAEQLWDQTLREGQVDPSLSRQVADSLAQMLQQNQRSLVALTALCQYDNYTFTHMVNVGILTMAQAQGLGIDGAELRQFGLAGLMHDIGKIRVPNDILTKPSKLDDREFGIMKQHPVDGAEILRRQIEMPPLVAVVAFEHHLRIDGTGYPEGVRRPVINLATQLCAIADVYDAMRSQRTYQQAFPTDRILAVLQQNDGKRFDQHLVRRFAQVMGIYPPGNLVRLDTGAVAVVLRTHAPDPARPAVRVIMDEDGTRLGDPFDIALWDDASAGGPPPRIVTPVDPAEFGIDPLVYLESRA